MAGPLAAHRLPAGQARIDPVVRQANAERRQRKTFFSELFGRGDLVFDIGANHGLRTLSAVNAELWGDVYARRFSDKPQGVVGSVHREPQPGANLRITNVSLRLAMAYLRFARAYLRMMPVLPYGLRTRGG